MMITQKSLCDSIPVGGVTSFRMTTGGDYGTWRLGSSLKYAQKAGRFALTVSTPSSFYASTSMRSGLLLDLMQ
jgi:hypothetical protein